MARKVCAYGFDCKAMLQDWNLETENCPNKNTCGLITELSGEERIEIYQARIENNVRIIETINIDSKGAALLLLNRRGCPQDLESLGIIESLEELKFTVALLELTIEELNKEYVAPRETETHRYIVKRPYGQYKYNKLFSKKAIFEPQIREKKIKKDGKTIIKKIEKVKDIHLSKDEDARNIEGRKGIERRNRLLEIKTKIKVAIKLINREIEKNESESIEETVAKTMIRKENRED